MKGTRKMDNENNKIDVKRKAIIGVLHGSQFQSS